MEKPSENKTETQINNEKAVHKGIVYGILISLSFLIYNLLQGSTDFGVLKYLLIFALSSTLISIGFLFYYNKLKK